MAEGLRNLNTFKIIFRTRKLLCSMVRSLIGSLSDEIFFRIVPCIWYVTRVTNCTTLNTNVTELASCVPCVPRFKYRSKNCGKWSRWFISGECFQNHLTLKVKEKLVCKWRQVCRNSSFTVTTYSKHESFTRFCNYCNKKQTSGPFCYVAPLKPSKLKDWLMYFFFDT